MRTVLEVLRQPCPHLPAAMSYQAVSYAVDVLRTTSDIRMSDRLVLLLVAEHANRQGVAWPSSSTIAQAAGTHQVNVRQSLGRLVAAGILSPERRIGRTTRYRFPLSTPVAPALQVGDKTCSPTTTGVQSYDYRGVVPRLHEPVSNRSRNHSDRTPCDVTCTSCEGIGWIYEDDRHVAPCAGT